LTKTAADPKELEELLASPSPDFKSFFVPEPPLLFGNGNQAADPKLGLTQFGPCGTADDQPLARIRVGIIGTGETIQEAQHWLSRCREPIDVPGGDDVDPFLFPPFPGMTSPQGFACDLDFPSNLLEQLAPGEVNRCVNASSRDHAVEVIVKLVSERLDNIRDRESPPDVVLVALPEDVRRVAGAGRRPPRRPRRLPEPPKQLAFFDEKRDEPDATSRTLHRAIKGEGMRHGLPTQLVWPTTFKGGEGIQDAATRAWNFCTALYYKAKGMPWRVTGLAKGTCYVGISFFRPLNEPHQLQTSMAQAFSERGEGVVLRGNSFAWDKRQGPPRLSRENAKQLLAKVLDQYRQHHRQLPTRLVIHKSASFGNDEIAGFEEALGEDVPYYDFLSVTRSSVRFLRSGYEPPVRGIAIQIAAKRYVIYTRGYVPFLGLYPGLRIPRPIDITHARGSAPVTEVLKEFFALTRMNWNSADFASAEPITLGFSRKIGLILSELPVDVTPERSFRFYM